MQNDNSLFLDDPEVTEHWNCDSVHPECKDNCPSECTSIAIGTCVLRCTIWEGGVGGGRHRLTTTLEWSHDARLKGATRKRAIHLGTHRRARFCANALRAVRIPMLSIIDEPLVHQLPASHGVMRITEIKKSARYKGFGMRSENHAGPCILVAWDCCE